MQIKVNLQIFLFVVIFILTHQIEIYACIMLFAFIHELGHMLAGIVLKLKPKSLKFMPFGISIMFEDYSYKNLMEIKKILIAISGPLVNILIVIIGLFFKFKEVIIYSNILIALFNLLPLYPLDGGRILKGIIRIKYSKQRADEIVNKTSNILIIFLTVFCSITILCVKNIAILFILMYLWFIIIKENKRYRIKKMMYDVLQKNNKCIDI